MARASAAKSKTAGAAKGAVRAPGLTRDAILEAALKIGDASGVEGITTRRLGQALGCSHMAVYLHFPSRDELLKAVFDRAISRSPSAIPQDGPWEERARAVCVAIRKTLLDHPVCHPLAQRFPGRGVAMWAEELERIAADAGYEGGERYFVERLLSFVPVAVTTVSRGLFGIELDAAHAQARPEDRPLLREYDRYDNEAVFGFVVDCVIDGLKRKLPFPAPRPDGA